MKKTDTTSKDDQRIQFIFFGRLDKEKGCELLISVRERMLIEYKSGQNNLLQQAQFLIFGDGAYRSKIMELARQTTAIKYFGFKPREQLQRYIAASDYTLMPSLFLETFGLTALESLSLGVPVVGFKKGGLIPFILNNLAIEQYQGHTNEDKLYHCITQLIQKTDKTTQQQQCEQASTIAYNYTAQKRLNNFHSIIHTNKKQKKILLISDYSSVISGIETNIHGTMNLLENAGYSTHLYGLPIPTGRRNSFLRKLLLPSIVANIRAARRINKLIQKQQPDIIWRHSTSRRLGWLPFAKTSGFQGQQRMTYHDLGYFHPFPSKVHQLSQIPDRNLKNYLQAATTKSTIATTNPIKKLAVRCKFYFHNKMKHYIAQNIDKHFVPSPYLIPIVQRRLGPNPKGKVMLLAHYLREK